MADLYIQERKWWVQWQMNSFGTAGLAADWSDNRSSSLRVHTFQSWPFTDTHFPSLKNAIFLFPVFRILFRWVPGTYRRWIWFWYSDEAFPLSQQYHRGGLRQIIPISSSGEPPSEFLFYTSLERQITGHRATAHEQSLTHLPLNRQNNRTCIAPMFFLYLWWRNIIHRQ